MKKHLLNQTIKFILLLLFLLIFGRDDWFDDKLKDMLFVILYYLFFIFISSLSFIYRRPLKVKVRINNSLSEQEKSTTLYVKQNKLETVQDQRTIDLTISYKRQGSLWWRIILYLLRRKYIYLYIASTPSELDFQVLDNTYMKEVKLNNDNGFDINLNDLLNDLYKTEGEYGIRRKYQFFIIDHPDIQLPIDSTYKVIPRIKLKRQEGIFLYIINRFILYVLLDFNTESHEIKYYKRG